ncbi:hypothetical protein, partial [Rhizobium sp. Rhizsp42]|uniref:hypothetical protein n=1 Tax=Rhizobium sp. Rhizsp42 TaxID=3243034 RepID=UPI0039B06F17
QRTDISVDPANSAAHVSLSSHLQLSNNRPVKPVEIPRPKTEARDQSASQPIKEIQSESQRRQQRRRPRSVKRLIRPLSRTSQQAFFKKS